MVFLVFCETFKAEVNPILDKLKELRKKEGSLIHFMK